MDSKTQAQWEYNFKQVYSEPQQTYDQGVALMFASNCAAIAKRGYTGSIMVYGSRDSKEVKAWKEWREECLSRVQALYKLSPIAMIKHVDEGGIGEDFYPEGEM